MSTQKNNFTVENLVAKYYNYVEEHCPCDWRDEEGRKHYDEPSSWTSVGKQLLIVLYRLVEGNDAQKTVVDALSDYASAFYTNVLSEDEMSFLCSHYKEVVSYLFAHRDEWTAGIKYHLNKISVERERLVKEYAKPKDGTTVFIADTEYCDLAVQFPNCIIKGFTGGPSLESKAAWALGQIRMWALGIKSEIVSGERAGAEYTYPLPEKGSVDMVILRANADKYNFHKILGTACTDLDALYDLLKPNGKMIFFSESKSEMAGIQNESTNEMVHKFLRRVIKDCAVESIVSFEDDNNGLGEERTTGIMLVISKSNNQTVCVRNERLSLSKEIPASCIDSDILWPSYYLTEKPENGIALSEIVSYINLHEVKWMMVENKESTLEKGSDKLILSERIMKMVVAHPSEMANDYKDANLCQASLKKAGDSTYEVLRGMIVPVEQPSILLYGRKDRFVVGYMKELPKDGMATLSPVACLVPKNGIDVRYVAALLFTPDVKNQIISVCEGDISGWTFPLIMDKIIVPNHDEKERLSFLAEANYEALISSKKEMEKSFNEKFDAAKKEYINEVRMRKHDMGQYIFELQNTEDLMRYYLENKDKTDNFYLQIGTLLNSFRSSLSELSTMLDNLSKEDSFDEPSLFSISDYFSGLANRHGADGFKITYHLDEASVKEYASLYVGKEGVRKSNMAVAPSINIAPSNFFRLVSNILDNAKKHGFKDSICEDPEVQISVSIDTLKNMYIIDFRNNGNPLPDGIDKMRYGLKGEIAGKSAGTGLGGSYVKAFVDHYGGDYDIFMKDGWTVIRICLPIK